MTLKLRREGRVVQNARVVAVALLVSRIGHVNEPETHGLANSNFFEGTDVLLHIDWT
ncbi:MAG TPA: hypothetical protein VJ801_00025 [Polyangia bacterium]|jgi:hypothetical protein|nr:hypothetical protein [Polyangia bacterium]